VKPPQDGLLEETVEDLFEQAPCGYVATGLDGTILRVNGTFETWTGLRRAELLGQRRFQDLLSPGGRIYHETHLAPLLRMQGSVREIALEIVCADGSRLPALINSTLRRGEDGSPQLIRTTVFDATERRRYEQELLHARRREQDIAQRLQRSLLAGDLPAADAFELDAAYRPGVAALEVGGDWYDAFWLDERRLGLVVGDVVGRGLDAAATMGQLRSAVRAFAATGLGPGALLDALDGYARRHAVGRMATLVYAELDLGDRTLRFACAGHPPPLIVAPGEPPRLAWEGRSTPLDAFAAAAAKRTEAKLPLRPGTAVLLYTDGLVERRTQAVSDGLDRLAAEVDARRTAPIKALAGGLAHAFHDADHADDVCLLVLRLAGDLTAPG
jgi:sigma-B regulation protein RsbU (phosphoserine phosphatase)